MPCDAGGGWLPETRHLDENVVYVEHRITTAGTPESCKTSSSSALRPSTTGSRTVDSPDDSSSAHGVSLTLLRTRCTSLIHVSHTKCSC